ncbi:hypothetical protein AVEN_141595-1 [Araneus ventricosus]|uniref:Uncharacterized protein n=1 Tax=Araneus ventricosus TaxID=182803 RepID=A0A4Y2T033_ARAVE|nr:hypothetical protein AVEN_141595-1 [Araneus ventricosus]
MRANKLTHVLEEDQACAERITHAQKQRRRHVLVSGLDSYMLLYRMYWPRVNPRLGRSSSIEDESESHSIAGSETPSSCCRWRCLLAELHIVHAGNRDSVARGLKDGLMHKCGNVGHVALICSGAV